jgi:hypothetical protein
MHGDSSENDPRTIWQNQRTEVSAMILEKMIRQKARALHAKTRRELVRNIAPPLLVIALAAVLQLTQAHDSVQTIMFALAIAWALAGQYFLNRGLWSAKSPGDAAGSTGIEFCRYELQRQRSLFRRVMSWSFGPILLAISAFTLPIIRTGLANKELSRATPFAILLVLWIVSVFVVRMRRQQELQREIEDLDELEREQKTV